jgi:hypothetical protein
MAPSMRAHDPSGPSGHLPTQERGEESKADSHFRRPTAPVVSQSALTVRVH